MHDPTGLIFGLHEAQTASTSTTTEVDMSDLLVQKAVDNAGVPQTSYPENDERYKRLNTPYKTYEEAVKATSDFWDEVEALREKHHIPAIVMSAVAAYEDEDRQSATTLTVIDGLLNSDRRLMVDQLLKSLYTTSHLP